MPPAAAAGCQQLPPPAHHPSHCSQKGPSWYLLLKANSVISTHNINVHSHKNIKRTIRFQHMGVALESTDQRMCCSFNRVIRNTGEVSCVGIGFHLK